jgi:hypothetical protein
MSSVAEFLSDIANDELSDMFIGNRNNAVENRAKLLPLMNKAMLQAYAKHDVKYDTIQLMVTADTKTYDLTDPALTDPDPALDPLQVTEVINPYGRALKPHECRILGNILYFPNPTDVELQVVFKLKPVRFTVDQVDEEVILDLPALLIPWMSSWVAAQTFISKKDDASLAAGSKLLQLAQTYEDIFTGTNTTNQQTKEDNSKLCSRGFA